MLTQTRFQLNLSDALLCVRARAFVCVCGGFNCAQISICMQRRRTCVAAGPESQYCRAAASQTRGFASRRAAVSARAPLSRAENTQHATTTTSAAFISLTRLVEQVHYARGRRAPARCVCACVEQPLGATAHKCAVHCRCVGGPARCSAARAGVSPAHVIAPPQHTAHANAMRNRKIDEADSRARARTCSPITCARARTSKAEAHL